VIVACALLLLAACTVNPVTGRRELILVLRFPDAWRVVNARSTVGAASPDGRAT
jgi:hypothetical protein